MPRLMYSTLSNGVHILQNHGYAKIDDIRGNTPGPSSNETRPEGQSMVDGAEVEAGPSPTGSPHHSPPQMSPTHSAGSPAHQQRYVIV